MDDGDAAGDVGVGVLDCGSPVCCPARVADAGRAVHGAVAQGFVKLGELSDDADDIEPFFGLEDGEPRGVVAPVLKVPEAVDEDRDAGVGTDVSNNSAHIQFDRVAEFSAEVASSPAPRHFFVTLFYALDRTSHASPFVGAFTGTAGGQANRSVTVLRGMRN